MHNSVNNKSIDFFDKKKYGQNIKDSIDQCYLLS